MIIDLHNHAEYSHHTELTLADYLDASTHTAWSFAITEHNALYRSQATAHYQFFRGMEILNDYGDFVVFGVDEEVLAYRDIFALIARIHARHGILIVAHPFAEHGVYTHCDSRVADTIISQADAVEVYNGKCLEASHIQEAHRVAKCYHKACVGGSDAHAAAEIFRVGTQFAHSIRNEDELIHAIQAGECQPIRLKHNDIVL